MAKECVDFPSGDWDGWDLEVPAEVVGFTTIAAADVPINSAGEQTSNIFEIIEDALQESRMHLQGVFGNMDKLSKTSMDFLELTNYGLAEERASDEGYCFISKVDAAAYCAQLTTDPTLAAEIASGTFDTKPVVAFLGPIGLPASAEADVKSEVTGFAVYRGESDSTGRSVAVRNVSYHWVKVYAKLGQASDISEIELPPGKCLKLQATQAEAKLWSNEVGDYMELPHTVLLTDECCDLTDRGVRALTSKSRRAQNKMNDCKETTEQLNANKYSFLSSWFP